MNSFNFGKQVPTHSNLKPKSSKIAKISSLWRLNYEADEDRVDGLMNQWFISSKTEAMIYIFLKKVCLYQICFKFYLSIIFIIIIILNKGKNYKRNKKKCIVFN